MAIKGYLLRAAKAYKGTTQQDAALAKLEAALGGKTLAAFVRDFGLESPAAAASAAAGPRAIPQSCIDLVRDFEGFRTDAYPDPASGGEPWTIGYGTTVYPDGRKVRKGDRISKAQAEEYLAHDLSDCARQVEKLVKVPLNDNQFGALITFVFNLGQGSLRSSTLLKLLNAKSYLAAAEQFLVWNKARNKKGVLVEMAGLTRRRKAERALFLKPV